MRMGYYPLLKEIHEDIINFFILYDVLQMTKMNNLV